MWNMKDCWSDQWGWGVMENVRVEGNGQWEVGGRWEVWGLGQWVMGGWGAIGNLRVGGSVQWKVEGREKVWGILTFIYFTLLKLDKFKQVKEKQ